MKTITNAQDDFGMVEEDYSVDTSFYELELMRAYCQKYGMTVTALMELSRKIAETPTPTS